MKKFAFVAALSACAVTLISLAPAQARPDESKRIAPTATLKMGAAVERTPEQMSAFDATFASPGQVREVAVRPTMDEAQYAAMKQAANMAPRMASRPGALAPDSPLAAVNIKFGGGTECDAGSGCWIPPDVAGSIGKAQFVSVSNDLFEVRSRGGVLLQTKSLNGLFGYGTTAMFDPRVQWDEEFQRWIVTADAFPIDANTQVFGIAVSKTNSATGAWWIYLLNVTGFAGANNFYDYPMLGMTQDAVLLTANIFTPSSFAGSSIFSVAKARIYNGFSFSVPVITGLVGTMETAHQNVTDQNGYAWYAAAPSGSGAIYMVAESYPANPNLTGFFGYYGVAGVPAYSIPPSAPQPSACGGATLDTLDNRFQQAGTQNGDVYYQVHTVANGSFSEPRYYVITGILGFAPTVAVVHDVFANNSSWDFNPSIASDVSGRFGLNWSTTTPASGFPAGNPGEHFTDNNGGNPSGASGLYVFTSASCYTTGNPQRWGDYSQVSVDPGPGTVANLGTKIFWIDNEIVPSVNFWSTEIAKITF